MPTPLSTIAVEMNAFCTNSELHRGSAAPRLLVDCGQTAKRFVTSVVLASTTALFRAPTASRHVATLHSAPNQFPYFPRLTWCQVFCSPLARPSIPGFGSYFVLRTSHLPPVASRSSLPSKRFLTLFHDISRSLTLFFHGGVGGSAPLDPPKCRHVACLLVSIRVHSCPFVVSLALPHTPFGGVHPNGKIKR